LTPPPPQFLQTRGACVKEKLESAEAAAADADCALATKDGTTGALTAIGGGSGCLTGIGGWNGTLPGSDG
jgi:hypothetical protein